MHRMPAMAVKEEENRQQARERDRHVHRTAVREAQEQTQETVSPVSRETVRVARIVLRAEDRRATVRKEEETEIVTEEPSREEETEEIVLAETVPRMARDVRQDRARETEAHARMTEEVKLQQEELNAGAFYTKDNLPEIPKKLSLARKLIDAWLEEKDHL